MNDIYGIKDVIVGWPISWFGVLFFCFLLICIGVIYRIFSSQKIVDTPALIVREKKDFLALLQSLKTENIDDSEFVSQLSLLFKTFLEEEKGYAGITQQTLEEIYISKKIPKHYSSVIEKMYFLEYQEIPIGTAQKTELIDTLQSFFIKK